MTADIKIISDRDTWNTFIIKHGEWNFFQSFIWGELQAQLGHPIVRFGLYAGSQLVGIAQVVVIAARRGKFLHVRHGPIIVQGDGRVHYWRTLITALIELGHKERAAFIRVSPMLENTSEVQTFMRSFGFRPAPIHAMDAEVCWVLDITPSEPELLAKMRKTTRYSIKQAEKLGVVVEKSTNIADFLELYKQTTARHGFVGHEGITDEFTLFVKHKQATLWVAKHDGVLLSAAIVIYFGNQAIYHHGASVWSKVPASYLLQWRAIEEAKRMGKRLYNFWGIAPSQSMTHPWRGITLFKQGFGGVEKRFLHAQDLPLSPWYWVSYTIETVRKVHKGY
jgi:lipid II:glycine glycyltransferase (peptidoglycan interpeptide bridge formation enzyme)